MTVAATTFETEAAGSVTTLLKVVTMFVAASVRTARTVTVCAELVALETTVVTLRLAELELTLVVVR